MKARSSFGITKGFRRKTAGSSENAFLYDQVIIEENIDGFEVGCAVPAYELIIGEVDEIELMVEGDFLIM